MTIDPMQSAHNAPRCRATSKRTGRPCKAPAVRGWSVCRMHGAGGGGPSGRANGNYRHGGRTKEVADAIARRDIEAVKTFFFDGFFKDDAEVMAMCDRWNKEDK